MKEVKILVKRWNDDLMELETVEDVLKIGDGVTLNYYSDETPATVIEIGRNGSFLIVQEDNAKRIDNNGMSDCQDYEYSRNEKGRIHTFYKTRRKDKTFYTNTGRSTYNEYGVYLTLKHRRKYFDYSF